jgi:2-iminobutanoate/2-iminopropanoate deaminase
VFPPGIPKAIGPYSPVTAVGDLIFVSGQIPINPETGTIDHNDIEWQAHQVMKNLKNALEGADSSFSSVAKTTILLTDLANFEKVNAIYGSYFAEGKFPARACYAVTALPRGSLIEIEAVATRDPVGESIKKKLKSG